MKSSLITLHERAFKLAQTFSKIQTELIDILQKIEEMKGYF